MQECQVKLKCLPCDAEYYSLYFISRAGGNGADKKIKIIESFVIKLIN